MGPLGINFSEFWINFLMGPLGINCSEFWINLLIGPLGINFSEFWIKIQQPAWKKMLRHMAIVWLTPQRDCCFHFANFCDWFNIGSGNGLLPEPMLSTIVSTNMKEIEWGLLVSSGDWILHCEWILHTRFSFSAKFASGSCNKIFYNKSCGKPKWHIFWN